MSLCDSVHQLQMVYLLCEGDGTDCFTVFVKLWNFCLDICLADMFVENIAALPCSNLRELDGCGHLCFPRHHFIADQPLCGSANTIYWPFAMTSRKEVARDISV